MKNSINVEEVSFGLRHFNFEEGAIPILALAFDKNNNPTIEFSKYGMELRKTMSQKEIGELLIELGEGVKEAVR